MKTKIQIELFACVGIWPVATLVVYIGNIMQTYTDFGPYFLKKFVMVFFQNRIDYGFTRVQQKSTEGFIRSLDKVHVCTASL